MIGFYSYTVVLTYLGLASAAMGMILTIQGFAKYALFCLAFSGLCDMFDGKVARMKKNRTEDEKRFGIQIDSLCDVVCFGAFPMTLCYSIGMRGPAGISILVFYLIAGVIRLAFFNDGRKTAGRDRRSPQVLPGTSHYLYSHYSAPVLHPAPFAGPQVPVRASHLHPHSGAAVHH